MNTQNPDFVRGLEAAGGMTLRDWFAGQAMAAMLVGTVPGQFDAGAYPGAAEVAGSAYRIADAMLREREQEGADDGERAREQSIGANNPQNDPATAPRTTPRITCRDD